MRILQIAILSLVLTSCWTNSKIQREAYKRGLCGRDSTSKVDSVIVTKHDTVIVHPEKEGDEVVFDFGENCDSLRSVLASLKKNPIVKKKNGLTETVKSNGKSLTFDCKEDAYQDTLRNAREIIERYKSEFEKVVKTEQKPCDKEHRDWIDNFCRWFTFISLIICTVVGLWKTRNLWLHLIFPKV